eukprot:TRINITY_DN2306_c0_g1_i1.p1 TRINITY_DN2306_c0_g1~~TRINITY_DN2306_c0_g1_i1.p1  ORF type:complete len:280 (-),score=45.74 TRINITY_DN2306_c0_g1_i1:40-879(-)
MNKLLVFVVVLACVSVCYGQFSTYNQLYRTFLSFKKQPLTLQDAQNQGWTAFNGQQCKSGFGIAYSSSSSGPTEFSSGFLYFTPAGQISGFGVRVYSSYVPQNLIQAGYFIPVQGVNNAYDLSVIFRRNSDACSSSSSPLVLGDRLLVNGVYSIPLNSSSARAAGWVEGACIKEMGTHWSLDTTQNGSMSWNSSNLFPLMPMYGPQDGQIKAVLIPTPSWQYTFLTGGEYEGPFTNSLMCLNWCTNSDCTFSGTHVWTTMHWLFTDYTQVTCDGAKCVV